MPAKNDNITKDPAAAGRKKKGHKHKFTQLKEAIGIDRTARILENIERNIDEFIDSPDPKVRIEATRAFTEYYNHKRSTSEIKFHGTITFSANPKIKKVE